MKSKRSLCPRPRVRGRHDANASFARGTARQGQDQAMELLVWLNTCSLVTQPAAKRDDDVEEEEDNNAGHTCAPTYGCVWDPPHTRAKSYSPTPARNPTANLI